MKYLILVMMVYLCACNGAPEQPQRKDGFTTQLHTKEDSLYHDVMQGHDIGMAKMGEIRRQQNKVQLELDSIHKLTAKNVDALRRQALLDLQEELAYADHAMFEWMKEFNVDSARSDKDKRIAYLESEKIKVLKVRDHILNGLAKADSLFKF